MSVSFTEHGNVENHSPCECLGPIWKGSSSQPNYASAHSGLKCHFSCAFNPAAEALYYRSTLRFRSRPTAANCFRPCDGLPLAGRRWPLKRAPAGSFVSAGAAIKPSGCVPPEPRRATDSKGSVRGSGAKKFAMHSSSEASNVALRATNTVKSPRAFDPAGEMQSPSAVLPEPDTAPAAGALTEVSPSEKADPATPARILIAEDNKADVFLIRESLRCYGVIADLHIVEDGEAAVRFITAADTNEDAPCPDLIVVDLNLPRKDGKQVIFHVRQSRKCAKVPVIVVTSSSSSSDRYETALLGATEFFTKPSHYTEFLSLGHLVRTMLTAGVR
jgi:chemotaxis family two-component system response regulator Rcp1